MSEAVRALLLDAGGTLLHPAEPVAETYARVARRHGVQAPVARVRDGFRRAFAAPWPGLRYVGDGRPFWRFVVAEATGSADPALFEALYAHYAQPDAWRVDPAGRAGLGAVRRRGGRTAVVSNWDTRLGPLLAELGLVDLLDAVVISAEVGAEKPDPAPVRAALSALSVAPGEALMIGDGPADRSAAEAAGVRAWILGHEIADLEEARRRLDPGRPDVPA